MDGGGNLMAEIPYIPWITLGSDGDGDGYLALPDEFKREVPEQDLYIKRRV